MRSISGTRTRTVLVPAAPTATRSICQSLVDLATSSLISSDVGRSTYGAISLRQSRGTDEMQKNMSAVHRVGGSNIRETVSVSRCTCAGIPGVSWQMLLFLTLINHRNSTTFETILLQSDFPPKTLIV